MKMWYVIQTKPHKEKVVICQLKQAGFATFFPVLRDYLGSKPLFPSYVFVAISSSDLNQFRLIGYTRGVVKILGTQETGPVPVATHVIDWLCQRADSTQTIHQDCFHQIGEEVMVRRGILKDLMGIIKKPVDALGRLHVLFKVFNHSVHAVLSVRDVVPVARNLRVAA